MVNNDIENNEEYEEVTDEITDMDEAELEEIEAVGENKFKKLQAKLKQAEEEKRDALEELAVAKADFLNGKRRLEEEKQRGIERQKIKGIEAILPLCDSFYMAMADKEAWEAADDRWRKGIEGIYAQLQQILSANNVTAISPVGDLFDPAHHDAIGTEPVEDEKLEGTIVSVMQQGYSMKIGDNEETVRAARVTTGVFEQE